MISKKFTMTSKDWEAVKYQSVKAFFPILAMYLSPIIFILTEELRLGTFVFSWSMFVPSQLVIGGIILYLLNRVYDPIVRYVTQHKV